jgi:hypothetical protein
VTNRGLRPPFQETVMNYEWVWALATAALFYVVIWLLMAAF